MDETTPPRLEIQSGPGGRTLVVRGELDAHAAPSLEERLGSLSPDTDVTLDLEGVTFVDSSGLRVLISQHRRLADAGARLVVHSPSPAVTRLVELTGLTDHLHLS
jgi:anti-sigma B factor antagonist